MLYWSSALLQKHFNLAGNHTFTPACQCDFVMEVKQVSPVGFFCWGGYRLFAHLPLMFATDKSSGARKIREGAQTDKQTCKHIALHWTFTGPHCNWEWLLGKEQWNEQSRWWPLPPPLPFNGAKAVKTNWLPLPSKFSLSFFLSLLHKTHRSEQLTQWKKCGDHCAAPASGRKINFLSDLSESQFEVAGAFMSYCFVSKLRLMIWSVCIFMRNCHCFLLTQLNDSSRRGSNSSSIVRHVFR